MVVNIVHSASISFFASMKKPSQPRYNVEERYTALLKAGEIVFAQGYDLAQPKLIAEQAGVSVGLFYRHFKNKRELLTEIMVRHLNRLHNQIANALTSELEVEAALHTVLLLTLNYFHQHQSIVKLFFLQIGYGDFVATSKLNRARQTYRGFFRDLIQEGMKQKVFLDSELLDIELAINSIIGTINWSIYDFWIVQQKPLEPQIFTDKLLAHLLRSLQA